MGVYVDWSKEVRFICIGGRIGHNLIPGIRLAELYRLSGSECRIAESDNDPRLLGQPLHRHPEWYSILRPVDNKPGSLHTANGYGFPHVDLPMTPEICTMVDRLSSTGWTELDGMAILADLLEENNYNDPRFPWLLPALRDPEQAKEINKKIWKGVLLKNILRRLTEARYAAQDLYKQEMEKRK